MNKSGLLEVIEMAAATTGLPLQAESNFERRDQEIQIRIQGLNELESFHFVAHRSPMAWVMDLVFDTFALPLMQTIASRLRENQNRFTDELNQVMKKGYLVETNIHDVDSQEYHFQFRIITHPPVDQASQSRNEEIQQLTKLLENALLLIYALLAGFDNPGLEATDGEDEGERIEKICGKYSRSPKNRMLCLEKYGFLCTACGLNPEKYYGPEGKRIIHIHHKTPLSLMSGAGQVSPWRDLVPLCPNCHNFAHKRNPPYSLEEIQDIIAAQKIPVIQKHTSA